MGGDKLKRILFKGDKVIWIVFITLCAISWIEVFSATSRQTYGNASYWSPIIKHTCFLLGGIFVAWVIHNLKAEWIDKGSKFFYWAGLLGLIWAQLSGTTLNGSARWINIFGFTFQPMEIAKLGLVMMTARMLATHQDEEGATRIAFSEILKYCAVPTILIFKENFSSAALIVITIYLMMFVGRIPKQLLLKTLGVGAIIGIIGFIGIMCAPESIKETRFGSKIITWQHRFEGALKPRSITAEEYDMNENEQRTYSHIAIASSHIIGRGPGNSIQRDFIPHAYSDYIFAVIIEELGLLGAAFVILLYLTLLYTCGKIAKRCDDPYTAYLAMGIGMIITTQALLHMFISVSDFVTGQPLPLMSQGGTSFLINSIYIGFILCISRYKGTPNEKTTPEPQIV